MLEDFGIGEWVKQGNVGDEREFREAEDKIWQVRFMEYDLGFFDEDENRVEPADNPFTPKVLPMSSVCSVTYVSGSDQR